MWLSGLLKLDLTPIPIIHFWPGFQVLDSIEKISFEFSLEKWLEIPFLNLISVGISSHFSSENSNEIFKLKPRL